MIQLQAVQGMQGAQIIQVSGNPQAGLGNQQAIISLVGNNE